MADAPRYLGTTAAAVVASLRAALGDDLFLRAYDLDGDGAVEVASQDEVALVRGVCFVETEIDEWLAASHGAPFTGTIPDSIRDITLLMAPWGTVQFRAKIAHDEKARAPFRGPYDAGQKRLARLASDKQARIPSAGAPSPTRLLSMVYSRPSVWGDGSEEP